MAIALQHQLDSAAQRLVGETRGCGLPMGSVIPRLAQSGGTSPRPAFAVRHTGRKRGQNGAAAPTPRGILPHTRLRVEVVARNSEREKGVRGSGVFYV